MRCLILLIIVTLIFIASVILTVRTGEYSFIFNFSIIPLLFGLFFFSAQEAFFVVIFASFLAAGFLFLRVGINAVSESILFLLISSGGAYYLRRLSQNILDLKERTLGVIKEEHESAYEFNKNLQDEKLYLEKMVFDINSLYQAPKKMISSSTHEELIDSFRKSLQDYFDFRSARLIIFSFKDKQPRIEATYNIPEGASAMERLDSSLAAIMEKSKEPVMIDRGSDIIPPEGLNLPDDIEGFIAVPLIAGERINGIFAIEGVVPEDMIRFMIIAHQFSMVLERIRLYELLQELAITDELTDVFVRRYFIERLSEELERAGYFHTQVSFIMLDLDNFKECNDRYGHLVGDVVLKEAAGILRKNLREIDIIGRYGGEEFSVALPEAAKDNASVAAERLRRAIEEAEIRAYDEKIKITVSMGVATFPDDTSDINQLIDKADQMLYKAKSGGRNRVELYG